MTVFIGLALYTIVIALNIYFRVETIRFLAKRTAITDLACLEDFKNLARRNMKAVSPLIAVILVGMALSAQLIIQDPLLGFVTFLVLNGLLVWSALALREVEKRARELPCPDQSLAVTYQRIAKSWLSDPWPDF